MFLEMYLNNHLNKKRDRADQHNFKKRIAGIKNILLILPGETASEDVMFDFASKLYPIFGEAKVSTFERRSIRPEDCNWFGLPHREYLRNITAEHFDLVVDLNIKPDKLCSYLVSISGAPLRLNLVEGDFAHIYNLHFRTQGEKPLRDQLQNILNYLQTIKEN